MRRLLYTLSLTGLAILWVLPVVWMASTAVKPTPEIFALPPTWIPHRLTLEHIRVVLGRWPFLRWFFNSVVIFTSSTMLSLVISIPAAFAFARLKWWGRDVVFLIFLSSMLVPLEVNVIPLSWILRVR